MEHVDELITDLDPILKSLTEGPPDAAATNRLRDWITSAKAHLHRAATQTTELEVLRSDIIARVTGMAKAIAVARNNERQLAEAGEMSTELQSFDAAELLAVWRKVSARFRETFRSSFVPVAHWSPRGRPQKTDYGDFK